MSINLDAVRARHARVTRADCLRPIDAEDAHADRSALLAEVDRLTAELAETRAWAYEVVCRSIEQQRAVEDVQHGDERARAALNSPRITLADARREARQ